MHLTLPAGRNAVNTNEQHRSFHFFIFVYTHKHFHVSSFMDTIFLCWAMMKGSLT